MTRSKKTNERKSHPKPKGWMYDARRIQDFVTAKGGYRAAGKATGLSHITVRSAAKGGNITLATFWTLAYALNISGCELLGGPCASKS